MIVKPQIIATPDCPTVMFRESAEAFDVEEEVRKALHRQGWGIGTRFNVHLVNHEATELLATASYIVTGEIEDYQTRDVDGYTSMSKTVYRRKCARLGEWTEFLLAEKPARIAPLEVKWNPGKKAYDVKSGDTVIATEEDKEKAHAIANGQQEAA